MVSCGGGILILAVLVSILATSFGADLSLTPSTLNTKSVGEKFSVTCTKGQDASTTTPGTLKWFKTEGGTSEKEMTEIGNVRTVSTSDPNRSLLMFVNGTESESGEYKCKYGQSSVSIKIMIQAAFNFVDTPREQNPMIGEDATIKCATSYPDAVISWTKSGKPLATNGATRYSIDNKTNGLIISAYRGKEDDGEYVCEAIHMATGKTIDRTINVVGHSAPGTPTIEIVGALMTNGEIHEGAKNVSLSCSATGVPKPMYTWKKNDQVLQPSEHYAIDQITGVLNLKDFDVSDEGSYECVATNAVKSSSTKKALLVFQKPTITKINDQEINVGQNTEFVCEFQGDGEMIPTWTHGGQTFATKSADSENVDQQRKYVTAEQGRSTLTLKNIQLGDAGEYQCQVENNAATVWQSARLNVRRSPLITSSTLHTIRGGLTRPSDMYCEAEAVPAPSWNWYRNGQSIVAMPGYTELKETNGTDANHYISRLTVIPKNADDFGQYECVASNTIEPAGVKSMKMIKIEPPQTPMPVCDVAYQKPSIVNLSIPEFSSAQNEQYQPTGINITFTGPNGATVSEADFTLADNGQYKIKNLEPLTQYKFVVVGRNEAGYSKSSSIVCSTKEAAAPGMPIIAMTSTETNSIQCNSTQMCPITWTLDDTGGRRVTRQEVQYRPVAKDGETEAQFETETIGGDEKQFVMKNLAPKTTYEVRIRAYNGEMGEATVVYVEAPETSHTIARPTEFDGMSAGVIVGIILLIVLLVIVVIDVVCYKVNRCGITMCLCVNLFGKSPSHIEKTKETHIIETGTAGGGMIKEKIEITTETKVMTLKEVDDGANESTPMVVTTGGQNGHHTRKDTTV